LSLFFPSPLPPKKGKKKPFFPVLIYFFTISKALKVLLEHLQERFRHHPLFGPLQKTHYIQETMFKVSHKKQERKNKNGHNKRERLFKLPPKEPNHYDE